jgi:hypothetical protein
MRSAVLAAAGLAAALLVSAPAQAKDRLVTTVEEAQAVAPDATTARVRLGPTDVLRKVVERAPGIETLVLSHPGNDLDPEALPLLLKLPSLTSLTMAGDAFLYDDEFATLGKLTRLKTLNLHLP